MSRRVGANKYFTQAVKTVSHLYDAEVKIDAAFLDAVNTMVELSTDTKCAVTVRMAAAKFIIEAHNTFAKAHGKNPNPKDYKELSTTYKETKTVVEDEPEDNVLQMTYNG